MFFENKLDCQISKRPNTDNKAKEDVTFNSWLYAIKRLCESSSSKDESENIVIDKPVGGKAANKKERKAPKDSTTIPVSKYASK